MIIIIMIILQFEAERYKKNVLYIIVDNNQLKQNNKKKIL